MPNELIKFEQKIIKIYLILQMKRDQLILTACVSWESKEVEK